MSSQFTNNKNKELLWNLLLNNGAFNNLREDQLPVIQNDFQNLILSLYNENSNLNLIEQNKLFVQQMVQKINSQKQQMKIYEPVREIYTSQDIRNKKLDEFNSNVEKAQNEFNSVITLKTPEEINFSDSKDLDKPISNMDELIEKTIAERNLDVNNINIKGDSKDNVEKWLNLQEEKQKQVSFNETNNQVIEPSSNSVDDNKFLTLLTEIKSNQLEILELLRNK